MNNIQTDITKEDIQHNEDRRRRDSVESLAEECLEHLKSGAPFITTFTSMPEANKVAVEAELKERFERWANTWVAPKLRQIILKSQKPQKK